MAVTVSHVKPSNCFRRLEKLVLSSIFWHVCLPWWCETCRVIQQQFWMKECDILWGQNIVWPLLHIFRGVRTSSTPHDLRPCHSSSTDWTTATLSQSVSKHCTCRQTDRQTDRQTQRDTCRHWVTGERLIAQNSCSGVSPRSCPFDTETTS